VKVAGRGRAEMTIEAVDAINNPNLSVDFFVPPPVRGGGHAIACIVTAYGWILQDRLPLTEALVQG